MALVLIDRAKETTNTTGTGTLTLAGAVSGYQTLSGVGDGNTTFYTIESGTDWEVGVGTYTSSGTTLSRDLVLSSSSGGSKISVVSGAFVWVDYPAGRAVTTDNAVTLTNKTLTNPVINGFAGDTSVVNIGSGQFYKDASGNVGIGTSSPILPLTIGASASPAGVTVEGEIITSQTTANTPLLSLRKSASSGNPVLGQFCSSGTADTPTAVADGRGLGRNNWYGFDGTNYINAAFLAAAVDGTPTTGSVPGRLIFGTTASGNSTPTERMRIDSSGNVGVGTSSPSVKLDVIGSIEASAAATQDGIILAGRAGGTSSFAATLTPTTLTASRTITLPDATTTMVGTDTTQTLTNKTLSVDDNTLSGVAASSFVLSNGSGNIDGSAAQKAIPSGVVVGTTDTQTLTNKTLTEPIITGTIVEDIFALTDASTVDIDPGNGSIQTLTLTGTGRTLTFTNMINGEAITLMVNDGTAGTITTWNATFVNNNGVAPTLSTTGFTVVSIWEVGGVVYAAVVGNA